MSLITTKDVQERLDAWGFCRSCRDCADQSDLSEHLAGNLSMVAEARADKRLEAGEALAEAAKLIMDNRIYVDAGTGDPCSQCEMVDKDDDGQLVHDDCPWEATESALAAYEEAAS